MEISIFTIFRYSFSTRKRHRTNTNLLSNFRQIVILPLIDSITWYYLSLLPKVGIEKWQISVLGHFEATILDWEMTAGPSYLIFMLRAVRALGMPVPKLFEITVLMLWFFKNGFVITRNLKNSHLYPHFSNISLYQNLTILAFPKSAWTCERFPAMSDL